jgi:hypothetical protein
MSRVTAKVVVALIVALTAVATSGCGAAPAAPSTGPNAATA